MKIKNKTLSYKTKEELDFIDITDEVITFIKETGIKNGIINIQTKHTTTAIVVNENEPLLIEDIKDNLRKLAPKGSIQYRHDNFEIRTVNMCDGECANGHSHCKAIYLPTNVSLNIISGKIEFGLWQRIFLYELDRARERNVSLIIIGE